MRKLLPALVSLLVTCAWPLNAQADEKIMKCSEPEKARLKATWAQEGVVGVLSAMISSSQTRSWRGVAGGR